MFKSPNAALIPMMDKRVSRDLARHGQTVDAEVMKSLQQIEGQGQIVEGQLDTNAQVVIHAANNEMGAAEYLRERAGRSAVAQKIAADRMNRLLQADDRTMTRGGF